MILSQANPYHAKLATDLREEILNQAQQLKTVSICMEQTVKRVSNLHNNVTK